LSGFIRILTNKAANKCVNLTAYCLAVATLPASQYAAGYVYAA
jgi:hypothetical protein